VTDTITLPRAVVEQVREALEAMQSYAAAERKGLRICDESITALEAALAEPPATREPATVEQIDEEYIGPVIDARWHDFEAGFRAAERFHGIRGSK